MVNAFFPPASSGFPFYFVQIEVEKHRCVCMYPACRINFSFAADQFWLIQYIFFCCSIWLNRSFQVKREKSNNENGKWNNFIANGQKWKYLSNRTNRNLFSPVHSSALSFKHRFSICNQWNWSAKRKPHHHHAKIIPKEKFNWRKAKSNQNYRIQLFAGLINLFNNSFKNLFCCPGVPFISAMRIWKRMRSNIGLMTIINRMAILVFAFNST